MYENYLYAIELGYNSMFATPDSFSEWKDEDIEIVRQQLELITDHYIDYWKTHKKAPISYNPLLRHMRDVKEDLERIAKGEPSIRKPITGKCGYGQNRGAAVSPVGDLYGCQEMTSNEGPESIFYIGDIYDGPIDALRSRMKTIFDRTTTQGDIPCEQCKANIYCNGGCIANNYM
jgi:uncharacterized protein